MLVTPLVTSLVQPLVTPLVAPFQRFFTTLASASSQNGSFTAAVTCDRIVMDVNSPTGSNTGLPTGAPVPTANKLVTLDFAFAGGTIQDFGKNGASFFDGIIANIRLFNGPTLVASVNWDGDGSASETNKIDGSNPLLLTNITTADAELFTRQTDGDFLGVDVVINGSFATDTDWTKGGATTISGGAANFVAAGENALFQNVLGSSLYRVNFDITAFTSGLITVWSGANESSTTNAKVSGIGNKTIDIDGNGGNGNVIFGNNAAFTMSIDNASAKRLLEVA